MTAPARQGRFCPMCHGYGRNMVVMGGPPTPCPNCEGTGRRDPCSTPDFDGLPPAPGGRACRVCRHLEHSHPTPA